MRCAVPLVSKRDKDRAQFAPMMNSFIAVPTHSGSPIPPNSGFAVEPIYPFEATSSKTFLKESGTMTLPLSYLAPILSPSTFVGAITFLASFDASSIIISRSSFLKSEKRGFFKIESISSHSKRLNLASRTCGI